MNRFDPTLFLPVECCDCGGRDWMGRFDLRLPSDPEAEDNYLGCILIAKRRGLLLAKLDVDDFYLGTQRFPGWLFQRMHYVPTGTRRMLDALLTTENQTRSHRFGVANLGAELGRLVDGCDKSQWKGSVERIKRAAGFRRRIEFSRRSEARAWREWENYDRNQRSWTFR